MSHYFGLDETPAEHRRGFCVWAEARIREALSRKHVSLSKGRHMALGLRGPKPDCMDKSRCRVTPKEVAAMVAGWTAGKTVGEISQEHNRAYSHVQIILARAGVDLSTRPARKIKRDNIAADLMAGKTVTDIVAKRKIARKYVSSIQHDMVREGKLK